MSKKAFEIPKLQRTHLFISFLNRFICIILSSLNTFALFGLNSILSIKFDLNYI